MAISTSETGYKANKRVLMAKHILDSHDAGPKYMIRMLRDAGAEVVYIVYRVAEEIVPVALQEDVDIIGLSFYGSGALHDIPIVINSLREKQNQRVQVILGGIFSHTDVRKLLEMGVGKIYGPGTPVNEIIEYVMS